MFRKEEYFFLISFYLNWGVVSLFIFLEKTKQKSVVALESLRFQGRSPRQGRVIDEEKSNKLWREDDKN